MTYTIEILRSAQKQLSKIQQRDQRRIIEHIRQLAQDPRPSRCKKLSGRSAWRIRVGVYRIIYEIHDKHLLVLASIGVGPSQRLVILELIPENRPVYRLKRSFLGAKQQV